MTGFDEFLWTNSQALICLCTLGLAGGTYLVWPKAWNLSAHLAVAFWVVSVLLPVGILNLPSTYPPPTVILLVKVLLIGVVGYLGGIYFGGSIRLDGLNPVRLRKWVGSDTTQTRDLLGRAIFALLAAGVLLMVFSLAVMGFIPLFAPDAFAAKYLRGAYAAAYRPVAVPYRVSISLITLLLPYAAVKAFTTRRLTWLTILAVSIAVLLSTLQRGPAGSGLLVAIGVVLATRKRPIVFLIVAIAFYLGGSLIYALLSIFGVGSFNSPTTLNSAAQWISTAAATAPDVTDTLTFLSRWTQAGDPLTLGRTFVGGIVPGNYTWNPGVWTIALGQPGFDIQSINSGGLRLPLPVWGLVSFSWQGVIAVSFISGIFAGALAAMFRRALPGVSSVQSAWIITLYMLSTSVFVEFYQLSYVTIVQIAALTLCVFAVNRVRRPASSEIGA